MTGESGRKPLQRKIGTRLRVRHKEKMELVKGGREVGMEGLGRRMNRQKWRQWYSYQQIVMILIR